MHHKRPNYQKVFVKKLKKQLPICFILFFFAFNLSIFLIAMHSFFIITKKQIKIQLFNKTKPTFLIAYILLKKTRSLFFSLRFYK